MIKVQFKNNYQDSYSGNEYTYNNFDGVEIGDIVVVNTNSGFALARVSQVDIVDIRYDETMLKNVECIVKTNKQIEKEKEEAIKEHAQLQLIIRNAHKKALLDQLKLVTSAEDYKVLEQLDYEKLIKVAKLIQEI